MNRSSLIALCSTNKQFRKTCKDLGNAFWREKLTQDCPAVLRVDELVKNPQRVGFFVFKHDKTQDAPSDYYFLKYLLCRGGHQTISVNGFYAIGILENGQIAQYPNQSPFRPPTPTMLKGRKFTDVSTAGDLSLGILDDGSIAIWGIDVLGDGEDDASYIKAPPRGRKFISVCAGHDVNSQGFGIALLDNGTVVDCGPRQWRYQGIEVSAPTFPNRKYVAISVGYSHAIGLLDDGTIVGWGDEYKNVVGQITIPLIPRNTQFVAISASGNHSLALLDNGTLIGWGDEQIERPPPPPAGRRFITISAGESHSLGLLDNGTIISWGRGPPPPTPPAGDFFVAISAGYGHSIALLNSGKLVGWGKDRNGEIAQILPSQQHHKFAIL